MNLKEKINHLANEKGAPCISISMNTHRTHPDNLQDGILLKNLLKQAEQRVIDEFGKRDAERLLSNLQTIEEQVDINYNLDSLHLFVSNHTCEIIRSSWRVSSDEVQLSDAFALRPLIKALNRSTEYLLLFLSQSGVHLFHALNDSIVNEIRNEEFPFKDNPYYITHSDKRSDPKQMDDMVRHFLNEVDKAIVKVAQSENLECLVICTEDNYSRLQQVADRPAVYLGYAPVNYNETSLHHLGKQAWPYIEESQKASRQQAIDEIKKAVAGGKVYTNLLDIYLASKDGRAELLLVHENYAQAVMMTGERSFDLVDDATTPGAVDDIVSVMAWDVWSKKGRVVFTSSDDLLELGNIALKVRY
jgi:hypothetical protein